MPDTPERLPSESWDLVTRAVGLRRRGAPPVTVLAALDQARASLRHEPRHDVARDLWWACRTVGIVCREEDRLDDVMRDAAQRLARGSPPGDAS